jgi:UDP-N-acetylglucosamine--N-acetylmuramyl-(pentapeptide) pyrophosphoryl-undecaprenol N-acetylglucosamine transferase
MSSRCAQTIACPPPSSVIIAGGGTGGHLFPGIAIAEEIRARAPECRLLFVSRGSDFERTTLERAGFALATIRIEGLKGRGLWNQARTLLRLPWAVLQSALLIGSARPEIVIGLGSYAAGPVVMAAWMRRVPVALCEQNTLPGVTNRKLARLADRIYTSFERTEGGFDPHKVLWTGNPLRREIVRAAQTPAALAGRRERFSVLVLGGSQGAHAINTAVARALPHLAPLERFEFVHQTGAADEAATGAAYRAAGISARVQPFFEEMAARYLASDLVVCRAGATTVAEITALGKPALFIPFPHAADDHQRWNAQRLVDAGAAEMILEPELSGRRLAERIAFFAAHPQALESLAARAAAFGRPDATRRIVDDCFRLAATHAAGKPADRPTARPADGPTG